MPAFDLKAGALGSLRLRDSLEKAEFLGRPDRDEQGAPRWVNLDYVGRGFVLVFENGQFIELNCSIALPPDTSPDLARGFAGHGFQAASCSPPRQASRTFAGTSGRLSPKRIFLGAKL